MELTTMRRHLRFGSWAAVSSRPQAEKESLYDQKTRNAEFVSNLPGVYPGYTGTIVAELEVIGSRSIVELDDACSRYVGYARLVELIKGRAIDAIVCRSRDRLGRSDALIVTIERLCLDNRVLVVPRQMLPVSLDVELARQSEGYGLVVAIESFMAEAAVKRLRNYGIMGMRHRVMGLKKFPRRPPYGYRYLYGEDGESTVVVVEEQAAAVREIVRLFLAGQSFRVIGEALVHGGFAAPPVKATWDSYAVKQIVNNIDRWAGVLTLYKFSRRKPEVQSTTGTHQPIISSEDAALVKGRLASIQWKKRPFSSPLTGVVTCNQSGEPMRPIRVASGKIHFCCYQCAVRHSIAATPVLKALEAVYVQLVAMSNPAEIAKNMLQSSMDTANAEAVKIAGGGVSIGTKKRKLLKAYLGGDIDKETFNEQMKSFLADERKVEAAMQDANRKALAIHSRLSEMERYVTVFDGVRSIQDMIDRDEAAAAEWLKTIFRVNVAGAIVSTSHKRRASIVSIVIKTGV